MSKKEKKPKGLDISRLSKKEAASQIDSLRKQIRHHNQQYYEKNEPKISDVAYDRLFARLVKLEKRFPQLDSKDSPTKKIGAQPVDELKKVKHTATLYSLNAVVESQDVESFLRSVQKKANVKKPTFILEPKFDGFSVEAVFKKGCFIRGSTRGDGIRGEDITHNLRMIRSFPKRLRKKCPSGLVVRGEIIMPKKAFQKLNKKRVEYNQHAFANPRNAAAGIMRQLDPKKVHGQSLEARFYECLLNSEGKFSSQWRKIQHLKRWGLTVDSHRRKAKSFKKIKNFHQKMSKNREKIDYEIDGIVIKCDEINLQKKLGTRERSPHWALAWKFKPRQEVTILEDIVVQVGRTGMLTPVALLQPVNVGGVTVSRATLHNETEVHKKDIRPKDKVRLARAGDVIPEVVEKVQKKKGRRSGKFHMPSRCPSCGSKTFREGAYTFCSAGLSCQAQLSGRIMHYASRSAMDIRGLGEETVKQMVERRMIKDMADIYDLNPQEVSQLEGFSQKSSCQLINSIHQQNKIELDRFLYALGIRHVGRHIARILCRVYDRWQDLAKATEHDLTSIDEIGPEIAQSINQFFKQKRNKDVIRRILQSRVSLKIKKRKEFSKLKDKKFVFTGGLKDYTREQAKEEIEMQGGRASSSVSQKTDFVVAGNDTGKKLDQARKYRVKIINEQEFKNLINY